MNLDTDYQLVKATLESAGDGDYEPLFLNEAKDALKRIYEMAWMYLDLCK